MGCHQVGKAIERFQPLPTQHRSPLVEDTVDPGGRIASPTELFLHVLLVQVLDGLPIEEEFLGHVLDGSLAAASTDKEGETFGVEGIVGEPFEAFGLHGSELPTQDPSQGIGGVDLLVSTGEVADTTRPLVVEGPMHQAADVADRFFGTV